MRFMTLIFLMFWALPIAAQEGATVAPPTVEAILEDAGDAKEERAAVVPPEEVTAAAPATEDVISAAPPVLEDAKVPVTDAEVGEVISHAIDAAQGGYWQIFFGCLILLAVYVLNKLGLAAKLGPSAVPWVAVALGIFTAVAIGMASGTGILNALQRGFFDGGVNGGIAVALWELVAKHLLKPRTAQG